MEPTTHSATDAAAAGIGFAVLAIYGILFLIYIICFIKVLIALFKKEGAGLGILGLLCAIYAYIWGWMKSKELGLKSTMIWWTLSMVGFVGVAVLGSVLAVGAMANDPTFQKEFKKQMEEAQRKGREQQLEQPK